MHLKLYVSISAHGYGHIAQTGPVLQAWARRYPDTRFTVACNAPATVVRSHVGLDFVQSAGNPEVGMRMRDALQVLPGRSHEAYLALREHWRQLLAAEVARIRASGAELVVSNVSFLTMAAAARVGVPAVAMCSLNWADIYQAYCAAMPGADGVLRLIRDSYREGGPFLVAMPGMVPQWHDDVATIGPISQPHRSDRSHLRRALGVAADTSIVAIATGGVDLRLPVEQWPRFDRVHWLVPDDWRIAGPNISPISRSGRSFRETLLDCDAALTKPGYGTFVDAACHGLPLLYVDRDGWPEQPCLVEWLQRFGRAQRIGRDEARNGRFESRLHDLLARAEPPRPLARGAEDAVARISRCLD